MSKQEPVDTPQSMEEILHPGSDASNTIPDYPHAPRGWHPDDAVTMAKDDGLKLGDDHMATIRALQEYFDRHRNGPVNLRELHDALDERFHQQGGLRFLYEIFPGGPVAQGCLLAGLKAPPGAKDLSLGSVV
jgi:tRNA 2-thiouridine synthesizing protein E